MEVSDSIQISITMVKSVCHCLEPGLEQKYVLMVFVFHAYFLTNFFFYFKGRGVECCLDSTSSVSFDTILDSMFRTLFQ